MLGQLLSGMATASEAISPRPVSNFSDWWQAAIEPTPPVIEMDVTAQVLFFDPHWKNMWVSDHTGGSYLSVDSNNPLPLKPGQRVRLQGRFTPKTRLSLSDLEVLVLEERPLPPPQNTRGEVANIDRYQHRYVRIEGLVTSQRQLDAHHVRFDLLAENTTVDLTVLIEPADIVPSLQGAWITADGVYVPKYDPTGQRLAGAVLWAPDFQKIRLDRWLADDPRLHMGLTSLPQALQEPAGRWVRVAGTLIEPKTDIGFTLRESDVSLVVYSAQSRLPSEGVTVEVIGRIEKHAGATTLQEALVPAEILRRGAAAGPSRLTSLSQWWTATEAGQNDPLPIESTAEVVFFDSTLGNLWITEGTSGFHISTGRQPLDLQLGDRILMTGTVTPGRTLSADTLTITLLERRQPVEPPLINGRLRDLNGWRHQLVRLEAYVESEEQIDKDHRRLWLVSDDFRFEGMLLTHGRPFAPLEGSIITVSGVYVPQNSPDGTLSALTLLIQDPQLVSSRQPLAQSPRFRLPLTTTDSLRALPAGEWVRMTGNVVDREPGNFLALTDDHGQVWAMNAQQTSTGKQDTLQLVGRVQHEGNRVVLKDTLFVRADHAPQAPTAAPVLELRTAAQVIGLPPVEAARELPVRLAGVVTWSHPSQRHFYLLDGSRGVRVELPDEAETPEAGHGIWVAGTTVIGRFASEIRAREIRGSELLGAITLPEPRSSTLQQALTGADEAQWIELSGYIRSVASNGAWTRLSVLTPGGEFTAVVPAHEPLDHLRGAIVRIRGVCSALTNERRQLTGVELWAPSANAVRIETPAPAAPFSLPIQSIASLQQFNVLQSTLRLVRIAGTVVHHLPGRLVFVDDEDETIRILSSSPERLAPGDRIEAVGLPGRENSQLVLREAVYRRIGHTTEPHPIEVGSGTLLHEDLDGKLVRLEATLRAAVRRGDELRLMLQSGDLAFDAIVPGELDEAGWPAGSLLQLTGVYELVRDEYRAPRSLRLQLRRPDDLLVRSRPPWLTTGRALNLTGGLVLLLLAGLGWVRSLRRRVRAQTGEIRNQLSKVASLEARHRGIIESASDFIFTANLDGTLTSINPAGEQLTGYTREEALHLQVRDLIAPEDQAEGLAMLDLWSAADGSATFQCRFMRKDGERVWVETSTRLLREDGRSVGLLGVVRDFTARRRHEEALMQARDAAEANARAKSTFLANMSHEMRTPMNGVIGMSNLLLDTRLEPHQHEFAETIRNSAESLLTVLNDILDFSKIEAGKLQLEELDFDINESVESTLELMAARASAKRLELAAFVPPDVPDWVRGDPGRLRQVLLNLLGNAIKFTQRGEIVVRLELENEGETKAQIRFEVTDTGIGLSPAAQASLFQPFTQADSSTTRRFGGTGLGLAICKQIVELMGGTIGVVSELGQGSTFWFSIPFRKGTPHSQPNDQAPGSASHVLEGLRVAVVDDHETNRTLLQHYLAAWGAHSECFTNGAEALDGMRQAAARQTPFGLALLDFQMPEMNGLTLAQHISQDPALRGAKCLLLTSIDQRFSSEELASSGIAKVMTKPIRRNDLRAAIRACVVSPETAAAVVRPVAPSPAPAHNPNALRVLVAEDNVVNQRVARLQLEKLGHRVDLVGNGLEVLEALERAPYDLVLMDCQMPEMDGYEATRRIRAGTSQPDILIVALTAHAMEGDREACLAAGMNDYLSKPVRLPGLQAVLEKLEPTLLQRRQRRLTVPNAA